MEELAFSAGVCEDFCGECFYGGAGLPCIQRQAGFVAGLFEEGDAVPPVLEWDLRQQKSTMPVLRNDEPVTADDYVLGANWAYGRKNAD